MYEDDYDYLPAFVSHGTANAYTNYDCRCQPCRAAYSLYRKLNRSSGPAKAKYAAYMRDYMRKYRLQQRTRAQERYGAAS